MLDLQLENYTIKSKLGHFFTKPYLKLLQIQKKICSFIKMNRTKKKVKNSIWECHIVEYMGDSKAHAYKIEVQTKSEYGD